MEYNNARGSKESMLFVSPNVYKLDTRNCAFAHLSLNFFIDMYYTSIEACIDPRPVNVYAPSAELEDAAGEVATGSEDAMGREPHRLQQLQAMLQSTV